MLEDISVRSFSRHWFVAVTVSAFISGSVSAQSAPKVLADVDHRSSLSLNGAWHFIVDPYQGGEYNSHREIRANGYFQNAAPRKGDNTLVEYDFSQSPTLKVPGDWNTQKDALLYYEGTMWYERGFDFQPRAHHRTFFHVGAANYEAKVWVNGKFACEHEGGFTPFDCEVTQLLHAGSNFAVLAVDNTRMADGVPTLNTDWWNYGGLTRDVSLIDVPESYIDEYDLHLNRDRSAIEGWVHVEDAPSGASATVSIPELNRETEVTLDEAGRGAIRMDAAKLELWSPAHPKLYRVLLESGEDRLADDIGFRTVAVEGTKILLNGQPIFLKGVAVHAEAPYRGGRANTDRDVATLLGWAHELGCNYVRLAHYPHDERMTRAADRMGILVWSEIPVYWAVQFGDPAVLKKAEQQLREEITRDRDKASIILWSIANETPATPERTKFLTTLAGDVRRLDDTRLVTAALLVRTEGQTKIVDDSLGQALDVIGANEYVGWYEKTPQDIETTEWKIAYDKPLIMSEFGAGAKAGLHGPATERWTEEYQADVFRHQLKMLSRIPQLTGMSPWLLMDFRSPVRNLAGIQDGYNRKGLVSNQGQHKQAFFVVQQAYRSGMFEKRQ